MTIHPNSLSSEATLGSPKPPALGMTDQRRRYVDAARGYVVFFGILALPAMVRRLQPFPSNPVAAFLTRQLTHAAWHGPTYADLGAGGFLFVIGASIPLALESRRRKGQTRRVIIAHIVLRGVFLFILGVFLNGGFSESWPRVRVAGVLQRIAICYVTTAILVLCFRRSVWLAGAGFILAGYALLLWVVPIPGGQAADFSFSGNWAAYVDRRFLPGEGYYGPGMWDPEGIVGTIVALATTLVGAWVIHSIMTSRRPPAQQAVVMLLAAWLSLSIGLIGAEWIPLNKPMWTPTFAFVVLAFVLSHFAIIYCISEVWQRPGLLAPCEFFGRNALSAYLLMMVVPFRELALRIVGPDAAQYLGEAAVPVRAGTELLLAVCALILLDRGPGTSTARAGR